MHGRMKSPRYGLPKRMPTIRYITPMERVVISNKLLSEANCLHCKKNCAAFSKTAIETETMRNFCKAFLPKKKLRSSNKNEKM
jgi:hypothetical protein